MPNRCLGTDIVPVGDQFGEQVGNPITEKLLVSARPKALVTETETTGLVPLLRQSGAVQLTRLSVAVVKGVPMEPVFARQEKVSAEPSGSLATASKVTCWPA
ncbi:hypothetical protein BON30_46985 [Cystobacter ferrugineus]|uniref:Uncharacterized protein n=1 Tax=Cystobacter ferrugineus TaxID=83449 RepID=A0A1L9AUS9_9BACT|nr:hypothetical protein BON30_46985 [Cystobacter ferrugineus]